MDLHLVHFLGKDRLPTKTARRQRSDERLLRCSTQGAESAGTSPSRLQGTAGDLGGITARPDRRGPVLVPTPFFRREQGVACRRYAVPVAAGGIAVGPVG